MSTSPPPGSRVLITGGAGFLGRHLADRLRLEGALVRLLDRDAPPAWAAEGGIEYIPGDVRNPTVVAAALRDVDTVVHAAFASAREPLDTIRAVNVDGTRGVAGLARACGVRRLILVSSTIVLWPRRRHPAFRHAPFNRLDAYRASRVEAEHLVQTAGADLSVAVARPKTFLGPGRVSAFALIFEAVRRGQPVPVLGRGNNRYQLLDVRDLADGLARLRGATTGVFGFGATVYRTVGEDLQALLDHAQTGARLRFVSPKIARLGLRAMELSGLVPLAEWHYRSARGEDSVVDVSHARRDLGWQPLRSNARTLVEAYDWYTEQIATRGTAPTTQKTPLTHKLLTELGLLLPGGPHPRPGASSR